jgi:molybdate transport system substrate-binding protein
MVVWIAVVVLLTGCGQQANHDKPADDALKIFAAASMTEVVSNVAKQFDTDARTSFGSTSELARQIEDGAPADVFISANKNWADRLKDKGRLDGDYYVFARNTLVCVAPKGGTLKIADPAALLAAVRASGSRVGIAMEGVPAGDYTRQSLDTLGLVEHFKPHTVGQKDVRAVLHAVSKGEVAAGFVYATDARAAEVQVLFSLNPDTHDPIEYYVAVVRGARNPGTAREFIEHLRGEKGRAILKEAGFKLP